MVPSHEVRSPAFAGAAAALGKFYKNSNWPEAKILRKMLQSTPAMAVAVEDLTSSSLCMHLE